MKIKRISVNKIEVFICACGRSSGVVYEIVTPSVLELAMWRELQAKPLELLLQVVGLRWHVRLLVDW